MSQGSMSKIKELPPQKKRVLALGGTAFIVLIFVSFLFSLSEEPKQAPQEQGTLQLTEQAPQGKQGEIALPRTPDEKRYDFEHGAEPAPSGGLEDLLNAPANELTPQEPQGTVDVTQDPFANMNGTRDELPSKPQIIDEPATSGEREALGPAPIPTEPEPVAPAPNTVLICDSFNSAQDAETKKALLAFQGKASTVLRNQDGTFSVRLGPFDSADQARLVFNELSTKGMLSRCALITR